MVAQLHTGHSLWLAGYLHRVGRRDFATCPHCNDSVETTEHLVLQCPAHDQARQDIWPGGKFNTDPRHLWDFRVHHALTAATVARLCCNKYYVIDHAVSPRITSTSAAVKSLHCLMSNSDSRTLNCFPTLLYSIVLSLPSP